MPAPSEAFNRFVAAFTLVSIGGVALVVSSMGGNVRICDPGQNSCETFTQSEYGQIKEDLAEKMESNEGLTWEEYNLMLIILNREIDESPIEIEDVQGEENIRQGLINKLRED